MALLKMRTSAPRVRDSHYQIIGLALITGVFATVVYRAATQSITADEAFSYLRFGGPLRDMLRSYDAANHVLYTLAAGRAVRWFGLGEFSLRLPAAIAAAIYLVTAFRISRYAFGRRWLFLAALAALTLNPFTLDFLVAARGYGLALALFAWGLFLLVRYLAENYDPPARLLPRAGLLFGLSVAANLVFLVPVVAVGSAFTLLIGRRRLGGTIDRLWGPGVVPAFALLVLPLANAGRESFYYGAATWREAVGSLVEVSFFHARDALLPAPEAERAITGTLLWILPALALIVAAVAVRRKVGSPPGALLALAAAGLAGSLAIVFALHAWAGVPLPRDRTGIYLPFLFTLGLVGAIRAAPRAIAGVLALFLVFAGWRFAAGFTTSYFHEWRYDAATERIIARIAQREGGRRRIAIAANWMILDSAVQIFIRRR